MAKKKKQVRKKKEKIKEIKKNIKIKEFKEESELEKDIQGQEEDIGSGEFNEFMQTSSRMHSPVLGKIAEAPEVITLEQGVASAPVQKNNLRDDDSFKYNVQGQEGENETKYTTYSHAGETPLPIDITKTGRDIDIMIKQKTQITPSSELRGMESPNLEKYTASAPERLDMNKVGRENPFEAKKVNLERKKMDYEALK
ncbi:MAG TPA: hypothetical protein ENG87_01435 [Candidatus Pacearchaeota archaeon]|nr:hypothetical protein BMS3Abin17_00344 [archaeon BMS3Abin17]HDK42013.1 hypothetical protein [Candidatus Pacearchaeota archaeon]HDZ60854.1 hypothetical protein [Candidatus Pacearchaeota archaeon]